VRALAALLALPWALVLAVPASAAEPEKHGVCWRGKPAPECQGFVITDFGLLRRLDEDPTGGIDDFHVSLDVGYARNVSAKAAVGGTIYLGTGSDHARVGVRGRYRRWLSRDWAVDASPGLLVYGSEDGAYECQAPGIIVGVTIGWKDLVGWTVEGEHSRYENPIHDPDQPAKLSDTTWRTGLKLGAAPGVLGTLAIVTLVVLVVASGAAD